MSPVLVYLSFSYPCPVLSCISKSCFFFPSCFLFPVLNVVDQILLQLHLLLLHLFLLLFTSASFASMGWLADHARIPVEHRSRLLPVMINHDRSSVVSVISTGSLIAYLSNKNDLVGPTATSSDDEVRSWGELCHRNEKALAKVDCSTGPGP